MSEQLSLDAAPAVRSVEDVTARLLAPHTYLSRRPKDTSRAAGRRVQSRTAEDRLRVLHALARWPMADERCAAFLGMDGNSLRPRRLELVEDGYVEDGGTRALTSTGALAIVWRPTDLGRQALAEVLA